VVIHLKIGGPREQKRGIRIVMIDARSLSLREEARIQSELQEKDGYSAWGMCQGRGKIVAHLHQGKSERQGGKIRLEGHV